MAVAEYLKFKMQILTIPFSYREGDSVCYYNCISFTFFIINRLCDSRFLCTFAS